MIILIGGQSNVPVIVSLGSIPSGDAQEVSSKRSVLGRFQLEPSALKQTDEPPAMSS